MTRSTLSQEKTVHVVWLLLLSAGIVAADRWTKWLAATRIAPGRHHVVIPRVFAISHVENPGAAFGLFINSPSPDRARWLLLGFSLLAAAAFFLLLLRLGKRITATTVALALILGGAVGNAYDRMRFGFVMDFIEVHIVRYHYPDFNIADSAIVVGGILLFLDALLSKPEA
jgi:signal peptidase II